MKLPPPDYPAGAAGMLGEDCWSRKQVEPLLTEIERLRADSERLDYIEKRARCDPKMDGQHVWWPTNFNHRLTGPTLRAAIDAARGK